jgi:outer membrane protein, heavy metal efflux system
VTFDLPIETAGKRGKRQAEAEQVEESARYSFINAAWQVRSGVRSSLEDCQVADRRAVLLQNEFSGQRQMVKLLQQRLNAGEISRPELTTAEIALRQTQLDLSAAESGKAEAHSHLAEALGLTEQALVGKKIEPHFPALDIGQLTSVAARRTALRSRADILAALADYAAAQDDLRLEIAKQYPDLHLGPAYAWNSGQAGDSQWSLGATLELPILDQNQGPIAEAEARRKLSAAKFVALQAQVIGEIDRAVAGYRVAQEQWRTGDDLLAAERRQEKSAEAQIKAGASDRVDGLNAELELSSAELARLDNEAKLQTALAALEDALQEPADSMATVIDRLAK